MGSSYRGHGRRQLCAREHTVVEAIFNVKFERGEVEPGYNLSKLRNRQVSSEHHQKVNGGGSLQEGKKQWRKDVRTLQEVPLPQIYRLYVCTW